MTSSTGFGTIRGGVRFRRRSGGRGLTLVVETVETMSSEIITAAAEGATNSFLKQYNLQ